MVGGLLLGATPLGQPSDASARLVTALGSANIVAAEDTRRVRTLATALGVRIAGKVVSFFDQNEAVRVPALIADMKSGATVLAITDAGMPLVSDPGYRLVTACIGEGITVSCLAGPAAARAAPGLPSEGFCFEGSAPRRRSARRAWLATLAAEQRTCVFFESPRRLGGCFAARAQEGGADRRGGAL